MNNEDEGGSEAARLAKVKGDAATVIQFAGGKPRARKAPYNASNPAAAGEPLTDALTPRDEHFAHLVGWHGLSLAEAFRQSRDVSNWADKSVYEKASHLAAVPYVRARIQQHEQAKKARTHRDGDFVKTFVIDKLMNEAVTAEKASERLRALELLGKLGHVRAFEEITVTKTENIESMSSKEIMQEIETRLKTFAEG
ncbi:hypothetical protein [Mongoliimonas terrestris]|uniref:hypothetical protein n=1 Tax=Mongoliimonas terrestris TaxID=1709001 RepID=UPI0009498CE9|nr:hypothetical protein [Mongoliimonas terrestris]